MPYLLVALIVAISVGMVNLKLRGHFIVGSSANNWWAALMGTSVEKGGHFHPEEKLRIHEQFRKRYPNAPLDFYREIPLIKEAIRERWTNHTKEMTALLVTKHQDMWSGGPCGKSGDRWIIRHFTPETAPKGRVFKILGWPCMRVRECEMVLFLMTLFLCFFRPLASRLVHYAMCTFLLLNVVNHLFVEAAYRYSYPLTLVLPVFVAGSLPVFSCLLKSGKKWYNEAVSSGEKND